VKRSILILMMLTLLFGTTSCGAPKETVSHAEPTAEVIMETKLGIAPVNQVEILMKEGKGIKEAQEVAKELGAEIVGEVSFIQLYQLKTQGKTPEDLEKLVEQAAQHPDVFYAGANQMITGDIVIKGTPLPELSDPLYGEGNNGASYDMIHLGNAWKILRASGAELSKVKVGVADEPLYKGSDETGGSTFEGDITEDPDKDNNGNIVHGGYNHGTMVSHVIGADGENGGVSGIASNLGDLLTVQNVNIFSGPDYVQAAPDPNDPSKFVSNGTTYVHTTLASLKKLADGGCKVINCSFGGYSEGANNFSKEVYTRFFEQMHKDYPDVVFVASAGNGADKDKTKGQVETHWPGGLRVPNLITVGALNPDGTRANFSNFQSGNGEVTVSTCGVDVPMGVDADGNTVTASGTSFAAPQVTAAIAILQAVNPKLTADEIKALISGTASPGVTDSTNISLPIPDGMGAGVLNLEDAVLKALNDKRQSEGKEPFTKETLLSMNQLDLLAIGGPLEYKIEASVDTVSDSGTDLIIDVSGEHALSGKSTQHVSSAGGASWEIIVPKPGNYLKVIRSDTGAGAWLNLIGDLSGQWKGTLIIEDVPPSTQSSASSDDPFAGCGDIDFTTLIGEELPFEIQMERADESGLAYRGIGTIGDSDQVPLTVSLRGTEVEISGTLEGYAPFTFVGTLSSSAAGDSVVGQWSFGIGDFFFGGPGELKKPLDASQ